MRAVLTSFCRSIRPGARVTITAIGAHPLGTAAERALGAAVAEDILRHVRMAGTSIERLVFERRNEEPLLPPAIAVSLEQGGADFEP